MSDHTKAHPFAWVFLLAFGFVYLMLGMFSSQAQASPALLIDMLETEPRPFYQWETLPMPAGIPTYTVPTLVVAPHDSHEIYLSASGKLFHSFNSGETYSETLGFNYIYTLGISESNPEIRYLMDSDFMTQKIYRSGDGGIHWTPVGDIPCAQKLFVAPSNPDRLYASGCSPQSVLLYRSDNGGSTWNSLPITHTYPAAQVAVHPTNPNLILVGTIYDKLFRSTDGGQTWSQPLTENAVFFTHPTFDREPPHGIYMTHWGGLFRSTDGGVTWGTGPTAHYSALLFLEGDASQILVGNEEGTWRVEDQGDTWAITPYLTPAKVDEFYGAGTGERVMYARTADGFYRYMPVTFENQHFAYLPSIFWGKPEQPQVFDASAVAALERLNTYRGWAGVPPVQNHQGIINGAFAHARYAVINEDNPAWVDGPHGETPGLPGFTGKSPSDRAWAGGWPKEWSGVSEVMHYRGNPLSAVDGWMATLYHRVIPLTYDITHAGYGTYRDSASNWPVDVMNFGWKPSQVEGSGSWFIETESVYPLGYPADGLTNIPTSWDGGESPPALPDGAYGPVGYPFTLQGVNGALHVNSAVMTQGGTPVQVYYNPGPGFAEDATTCASFNCYALIPKKPLLPNTTYLVTASGDVGGIPFNRTWTFTTGGTLMMMTEDLWKQK